MADIPIQEKKDGGSKLPLVLGALAFLALLGWCATRDDDADVTDTTRMAPMAPMAPAVVDSPATTQPATADTLTPGSARTDTAAPGTRPAP